MTGVKLQIAHYKTELHMISNCEAAQRVEIVVGIHVIASKCALKHLGVMDESLNLKEHVGEGYVRFRDDLAERCGTKKL